MPPLSWPTSARGAPITRCGWLDGSDQAVTFTPDRGERDSWTSMFIATRRWAGRVSVLRPKAGRCAGHSRRRWPGPDPAAKIDEFARPLAAYRRRVVELVA